MRVKDMEESLCLVFFLYSEQPLEALREEESDSLVEAKETAMKC